jgi:hypothetical protein
MKRVRRAIQWLLPALASIGSVLDSLIEWMKRMPRTIQWLLPALVSIGVLGLLLARSDVDLLDVLRSIDSEAALGLVPPLLAYGIASLTLEALSLVRTVERPLALWTAARIKAASYLAYTLHYTLGVATLTVLLRRRVGLSLGDSAGVVLLIAGFDLGVALVLLMASAGLSQTEAPGLRLGLVAAIVLVIPAGFWLLRTPRNLGPLERARDLAVFRAARNASPRVLCELLFLRTLFSITFIALVSGALRAFDLAAPVSEVIMNSLLVALVAALPIAVAGIGTGNAAFVFLFRDHGDPETLLACSLALSAAMIMLRAGIGISFAGEFAREAMAAVRRGESEQA